ncbi:aminoglycoside phosphotransferase [Sphingobium lactosutens]|uniref:phosphotransferase family protein n=1 Tax=Sphingobium lactosutens TaxID=522773 RepID=UPI0015BCAB53|nr:aminoglycoside phosphotransferase family protein [Sphingobium lactosutens]NWK98192.1 aminoglycoside phosphotransferase [Sphingobium lactosutens]
MNPPDPSSFIAAGASAQVYRLDGGRVLKLFHAGVDPGIIAREHAIARVVQASGLPVPRVFGLEEADGRQGIVYEEISGPNLLAYIARHPHRTRWALDQMARLQRHIQACHAPTLRSRKAILIEDIEVAPVGAALRRAAIDRLVQLNEGDALSHGDLHPGNLIVTDEGVSVIDWSRAACGTIATDLVRTEMVMRFGPGRGAGDVGRVEAAVRDAASGWYVRRYRALTGLDAEALAAWRALVALAWTRQRAPVRESAFAVYLADALRVAGLPPID